MAATARRYHEATKHSFDSVRRGGHFMDWSNKPHPFKVYEGLPQVPLPRDMPPLDVPALDALAIGIPPSSGLPDIASLARMLFLSAGVLRTAALGRSDRIYFRTYASAGALYPVEVYVVCSGIPGLETGLYHFDPLGFALTRLREGDAGPALVRAVAAEAAVSAAPLLLVLTGLPWRTAWKYAERGYRHLFWDAGMILANLLAAAAASGMATRVVLGFDDGEVEMLLGLDGRREFPLCVVALGTGDPIHPAGDPPDPVVLRDRPLSRREHWFELIQEVNDAGRLGQSEVAGWRAGRVEGESRDHAADLRPRGGTAQRSGDGDTPPWIGSGVRSWIGSRRDTSADP